MSLRLRLFLAFVVMVAIPLAISLFVVLRNVGTQLDREVRAPLPSVAENADAVLSQLEQRSRTAVIELGRGSVVRDRLHLDTPITPIERNRIAVFLEDYGSKSDLFPDFMAVTDATGGVLADYQRRPPEFRDAELAPTLDEVIAATSRKPARQAGPYTVYAVSDLVNATSRELVGRLVAGFWLDDETLRREVRETGGREVTLMTVGHVIATTVDDSGLVARLPDVSRGEDSSRLGDDVFVARLTSTVNGVDIVATAPRQTVTTRRGEILRSLLPVLVVSLLLAGLLGRWVARVTTRPLEQLAGAARRVAAGHLDTHIDISSHDEIGRLGEAFNTMTVELRQYVDALHQSRDELSGSLTRLGDTLSSTHDLKKMLAVVLETAMVTSGAEAGSLMLFARNRNELFLKVGRGLDGRVSGNAVRVKVGSGVAGRVARTGEPLHGRVGDGPDQLQLGPNEPSARSLVAVPLRSHERIIGVLSLYDRQDGTVFGEDDVSTIRAFANQASTAIDNVLLHQEAQRMSITDGLTGLWNYRYFQMKLTEELERSGRFHRPLALVILDLDHFKKVNDEHGHQRGDSVLIELSARVKATIREVDVLARYGGEEFVLVLPETDVDGAKKTAARICEVVRQRPFGGRGETPLAITVSVGAAIYPRHADDGAALIAAADAALYEAKNGGRDRYVLSTSQPVPPFEPESTALSDH